MQREILDVLATVAPLPPSPVRWASRRAVCHGRVETQADDELTTHHVCAELSARGWLWDAVLVRQVRRALDGLHRTGQVAKRLTANEPYYPKAQRALWRLR